MTHYVAFLRAVNVGGTGKLPMADLRGMAMDCGFGGVRTYIASGNLAFTWNGSAADAQMALEAQLAAYAGKPVGVMIRDADEMEQILADMPFPAAPPAQVVTIFLNAPPPADALDQARGINGEVMEFGRREIYVHYVNGQGPSKLIIPAASQGTSRNLNTVRKMAAWLRPETH